MSLHKIKNLSNQLFSEMDSAIKTIAELPLCVHEIDLNRKLIYMNRAGLDMINMESAKDIIGVDYFSFISDKDKPRVMGYWNKSLKEGISITFKFKTNVGRIYRSCFTPLKFKNKTTKIVGYTQDITDYEH